jgi:hypothetical protein
MTEEILAQARQIYSQALPEIFPRKNVVACGLGYKVRCDEQTEELSLMVSVVKKEPQAHLAEHDVIPKKFNGLVTDVIETGHIRAMPVDSRVRHRPAMPGISIGHHRITAGTFGLLVERAGEPYILSNNHVLANVNAAEIGDPIWQPGPLDGGTSQDKIATLADFVPLDKGQEPAVCQIAQTLAELLNTLANLTGSQHRLEAVQQTAGQNVMDVALARPDAPELVTPEILDIGVPAGVGEPLLGMAVQKTGRTTGWTEGTIQQIDVTVNVDYNGTPIWFTNQVFATSMSQPGDSGSAILDMERNVVGLLFAGSERVTILTPIQWILDELEANVVTA